MVGRKLTREYNIGIVCTANRLAVIDIDGEAGIEWIRDNKTTHAGHLDRDHRKTASTTTTGWPEGHADQYMPDRTQTRDPWRRRLRHCAPLDPP